MSINTNSNNSSNQFNTNNLLESIRQDINEMEKSNLKNISIERISQYCQHNKIYKKHIKNSENNDEYVKFKHLLKEVRQSKLPTRIIDIAKDHLKKKTLPPYDLNILPEEFRHFDQLQKLSKEERSHLFSDYESKLLAESSSEIIELASRINWLHGTNSSILAMLPLTNYTLLPTGRLLEKRIAPMCGEISQGGMERSGVNQTRISVDTIKGVERCWKYASMISNSFNPSIFSNPEDFFKKKLTELKTLDPESPSWDPCIISLYQLKQWEPQKFDSLCSKYRLEIDALKTEIFTKNSYREALIIKALDIDSTKLAQISDDIYGLNEEEIANRELLIKEIKEAFPNLKNSRELWDQDDNVIQNIDSMVNGNTLDSTEFIRLFDFILPQIIKIRTYGQSALEKIEKFSKKNKEPFRTIWKKIKEIDGDTPTIDPVLNKFIRPKMEARMINNQAPFKARFQRLESLFDEKPLIHFSADDKANIQNPFPILIASTKSKGSGTLMTKEYHISEATLGREGDIVFVNEKNIPQMKKWLEDHHLADTVEVYELSKIEEMQKIPLYHSAQQVAIERPFLDHTSIQTLNENLKKHVIPLYQAKYPNGSERHYHGVIHALRTSLFAQTLGSIYENANHPMTTQKINLPIAAALHDCARLNDGEDLWDRESGLKCKEIFTELKVSEEETLRFQTSITEKDSKAPQSLEQKIIHDADCIEIIRCLSHPDLFRSSELWMIQELDSEIVHQFIKDASRLIKITEKKEIKEFIESSSDPLTCLYQVLFHANDNLEFNLLGEHLYQGRVAFCQPAQQLLTARILEFIDRADTSTV